MANLKTCHRLAGYAYAYGEHCCAVSYAASELAFSYSHVLLYYGSGFLLIFGALLVVLKIVDRKGPNNG